MVSKLNKLGVTIVGGGFGGVKAALELCKDKRFKVTLISDKPHFEYFAGLYRTTTGHSPLETTLGLAEIFKHHHINLELDKIIRINHAKKQLKAESGNLYRYDVLILALGAVTNYFGIKGLEQYSLSMKSLSDALKLKKHLHDSMLDKKKPQNYVIVGGGPTGVELSAELITYLHYLSKLHQIDSQHISVNLVEASRRILPSMPDGMAQTVVRRLAKLGVIVKVNTKVEGETADTLEIPGDDISTSTVVWTAGVINNPLILSHDKLFRLANNKRVMVNEYLQAEHNLYLIGDNANTTYSGMAQTAIYDAVFVANNLKRQLAGLEQKSYRPKQPVYVIPVGGRWAAVHSRFVNLYGYLGWLLRRTADLRLLCTFASLNQALKRWRIGNNKRLNTCQICQQNQK